MDDLKSISSHLPVPVFDQESRLDVREGGFDVIHHRAELRLVVEARASVRKWEVLNSSLPLFVERGKIRECAGHDSVAEVDPVTVLQLVATVENHIAH